MRHALIAIAALLLMGTSAPAQDASSGYVFEQGYPTAATARKSQDDADYQRAITAYRF